MPNLYIYRKPGRQVLAAALSEALREVILPSLFERIWDEHLDYDAIDSVHTKGSHPDANKADIGLILVPEAKVNRISKVNEMKRAIRERVKAFFAEAGADDVTFEVNIAFSFGGGISDSGNEWGSQVPLLVQAGSLAMHLARTRDLLFAPASDMGSRVENLTASLATIIEVLAQAAGLPPDDR